jgi:hypothetical protein
MKRRVRAIWKSAFLLTAGIVGLYFWNAQRVGKALDCYRNVPVYDNGLLFFRSYGRHYSKDGYYYGQKWQCVEYIKRFFYDAKGHEMPDVMGHAKSFFDETLPDGALNQRRGLVQYRNGSSDNHAPMTCSFLRTRNMGMWASSRKQAGISSRSSNRTSSATPVSTSRLL